MPESAEQQIESLRRQVDRHNYLYYVETAPEISDQEFDQLLEELHGLEQANPELITPESPTQRVGGQPIKGFKHVTHRLPMMSIDNTYNEADLRDFDARVRKQLGDDSPRYVVEEKIDGVAICLTYENGLLTLGATRGDGQRGDDVTHNVRTIRDIPLRMRDESGPVPKLIEIRGEVYMTNSELSRLNRLQEEKGEKTLANPRNVAAGTLKLLDPKICAQRKLRFLGHGVGYCDDLPVSSYSEFMPYIRKLGLPTVPHSQVLDSIDAALEYCEKQLESRHELDYETDGMVVKVNEFAQREKLGATSKAPRWLIAYKVELWQEITQIEEINIQVGKTGTLTPVARLKTVEIAGTKVSRVSLHNAEEIARKDIRVGDTVVVEKAGKIIPHVVRVELEKRAGKESPFVFPNRCPVCEGDVAKDEGGVYIRCINPSCPAQLKERLRFLAHRSAMDIEGFGPAVIEQLVDKGMVDSIPGLFDLQVEQLTALERMGKKSAQNLVDAIAAAKDRGLTKVLTGLTIRHVGESTARLLTARYPDIDLLMEAGAEELAEIEGVGPIIAASIHQFFESKTGRKLIADLRSHGVKLSEDVEEKPDAKNSPLSGKTIVVTGTMEKYKRQEIQELIVSMGGKTSSSVSKKTDFVIAGSEAGSKLDKANKLGVRVLSEDEFDQIVNA